MVGRKKGKYASRGRLTRKLQLQFKVVVVFVCFGVWFCFCFFKENIINVLKKKLLFKLTTYQRPIKKQPTCIPILPALSAPSDLFFRTLDNVSSDLFFGMECVIASCFLDRCDVLWDEPEFLAGST